MGYKDDDEDELSQDTDTEQSQEDVPKQPLPLSEPALSPVQQAVFDKYQQVSNPALVNAARDAMLQGQNVANVGQALANIFTAKSQAYGGRSPDSSLFNSIRSSAVVPYQMAQQQRQQQIQDYLTQNQLGNQAQQFANQQEVYKRQYTKGTIEAQAAIDQLNNLLSPDQQISQDQAKGMSLADVGDLRQMVETKAKLQEAKDVAQTRLMYAQNQRDQQNYLKERTGILQGVIPSRGNPVLNNIANSILRSDHAEGMIYGSSGEPKFDANGKLQLNPQATIPQMKGELEQAFGQLVANGHALPMGEQQRLEFNSLQGKVAEAQAKLTANPTPTNEVAYVELLADAINRQKQIAISQMHDYQVKRFMSGKFYTASDPDWQNQIKVQTTLNGKYTVDPQNDIGPTGLIAKPFMSLQERAAKSLPEGSIISSGGKNKIKINGEWQAYNGELPGAKTDQSLAENNKPQLLAPPSGWSLSPIYNYLMLKRGL